MLFTLIMGCFWIVMNCVVAVSFLARGNYLGVFNLVLVIAVACAMGIVIGKKYL